MVSIKKLQKHSALARREWKVKGTRRRLVLRDPEQWLGVETAHRLAHLGPGVVATHRFAHLAGVVVTHRCVHLAGVVSTHRCAPLAGIVATRSLRYRNGKSTMRDMN